MTNNPYPLRTVLLVLVWFLGCRCVIAQDKNDQQSVLWHQEFSEEPALPPSLQQQKIVSLNVEPTADRGCIVSATSFLPHGFLPYIVKLTAAGAVSWHQTLVPGTVVCQAKQKSDGGYVAVGDVFTYNSRSIFIAQLNQVGQPVSQYQIPFVAGADLTCHLLLSSRDGGFMLVGLKSPSVGQPGKPVRSVLFLAKLTKDGQLQWAKTLPSQNVTIVLGGYAYEMGYALFVLSEPRNALTLPPSNGLSQWTLRINDGGTYTWQPASADVPHPPDTMPFIRANYQLSANKSPFKKDWQITGPANTTCAVRADADGNTFLCGTTTPMTDPRTGPANTTVWVRKLATAPLQLTQQFDCVTGRLVAGVTGGTGRPTLYQVAGVQAWTSDSIFWVPNQPTTANQFTVEARQGEKTVSATVFRGLCPPAASLAADTPDGTWWARLSVNPVTESAAVAIHGTAGTIILLQISDTNGREISRQQVMGTGLLQHCTLHLGEQPAATYLIRVSQERHVHWLKVVKQ